MDKYGVTTRERRGVSEVVRRVVLQALHHASSMTILHIIGFMIPPHFPGL